MPFQGHNSCRQSRELSMLLRPFSAGWYWGTFPWAALHLPTAMVWQPFVLK